MFEWLAERFWAKVKKDGSVDCWPWQGRRYRDGYGQFTYTVAPKRYKTTAAHRVAWTLANGRPPGEGLYICHSCDNPQCVNPSHLFEGTPRENSLDMFAKKRGVMPPREVALAALRVLTDSCVLLIIQSAALGESYTSIASRLKLSKTTVRDAATGKTWSALGGPLQAKRPLGRAKTKRVVNGFLDCSRCKLRKEIREFSPSVVKVARGWCRACCRAWSRGTGSEKVKTV